MPEPHDIDRMLRADAQESPGPSIPLDTAAIARGARRRRLPAQLGVGAAAVALVAGFGGVAIAGAPGLLGLGGGALSASESADEDLAGGGADPLATPEISEESDAGGQDGDSGGPVAGDSVWEVLRCGEPLPAGDTAVDAAGDERLTLELAPLEAGDAVDGRLTVTGTLTNVSAERIELVTATHLVVGLAHDGVVIWSTVGMEAAALTPRLEPGASIAYEGALELVDCGGTDPEASILGGSPLAGPGAYEVVAALEILQTDSEGFATGSVVEISPRASLVLP